MRKLIAFEMKGLRRESCLSFLSVGFLLSVGFPPVIRFHPIMLH